MQSFVVYTFLHAYSVNVRCSTNSYYPFLHSKYWTGKTRVRGIPLSRVAFRIFVVETRTQSIQHRSAGKVLEQ